MFPKTKKGDLFFNKINNNIERDNFLLRFVELEKNTTMDLGRSFKHAL